MHDTHRFLEALSVVLCTAAVTTVVFVRLRQPVILGYILAGLLVGPHLPFPLVADATVVETLSELGVILLMFSLGLEFRLGKLARVGPTAGLTAIIESSIMMWLGFTVARAFGWTMLEGLFTGAMVAVSSTTIIAKAFEERNVGGKLRDLVVGVLIVEDLIAILLMTLLTVVSSGREITLQTFVASGGRLLAFLVCLLGVGILVVPRFVRAAVRLERPETTLVACVGVCFATALLAREFGYSVALGAFLAGSLVAESGEEKSIEHLVAPVRDVFAAVFFVSVGMLIDPHVVAKYWLPILVLTGLVISGKMIGVFLGSFLTGSGVRTSVQAGMSLAQIGEFSFILVGLGTSLGATGRFLYPVAVAVSAVTTLTTPWLIRFSAPAASWLDRKLPRPLQTFASLYGTWIERLRAERPRDATTKWRRVLRLLLLDLALLAILTVVTLMAGESILRLVMAEFSLQRRVARWILIVLDLALGVPLLVGVVRNAGELGAQLARLALPEAEGGQVDLGRAPRRALVVALRLTMALVVGVPILALLQSFLPPWIPGAGLGVIFLVLGLSLWRSAQNLQGHVKAGAEVVVDAWMSQARKGATAPERETFAEVRRLLPGLGEPVPVALEATSFASGRTLASLNLRGRTGASVIAIVHATEGVLVPEADQVLAAGDVLALVGTEDAVASAARLLIDGVLPDTSSRPAASKGPS
jgi:CPA2 family monovalent cation:H+ antiporter-2